MATANDTANATPPAADWRHTPRLHRWLTNGLQFVMALALVGALYERQWLNAALIVGIILLTFLPQALGARFRVFIPPEFNLLALVFIFASLFLGEVHGYYTRFWWWDIALHAGSGLLLGILGFLLVYVLNREPRVHLHAEPAFIAFFAFVFAVAMGALWEIFEFAMDTFFGLNMQKSGLRDTMADLIVDTVGAGVIAVFGYIYIRIEEQSFLERWIAGFIAANPQMFRRRS